MSHGGKFNYGRIHAQDRMRKFGSDDVNGKTGDGHRWRPFHANAALKRKLAKAHRVKRKGLALPESKAELRAIAEQVVATRKT